MFLLTFFNNFIKIINNKETYIMPADNGKGTNFFSSTYIAVDTNGDETPEVEKQPEEKVEETPTIPVN